MNAERRPGQGAHPDNIGTPQVTRARSAYGRSADRWFADYEAKGKRPTRDAELVETVERLDAENRRLRERMDRLEEGVRYAVHLAEDAFDGTPAA